MARYPEFSRSTNLESKLIKLFVFVNFEQTVRFGSLKPFTVRKIGDFPHFLSALASNNQFIIKLVKLWPGKATLYSSDRARSCDRMASLVGDRGPVLRVQGWALTRMRNISSVVRRGREGS